MSELAGDWLKSRKLRHFAGRQEMWGKIDQFSKEVHNSLDIRDTAYTIANEGRRLIECDRVSVTVTRGHKQVVEAISGQDTMDTRSNVVTLLSSLATRVCATGEPLWYSGETQDLPPQLETALEDYVDESHTKSLAVLPLFKSDPFKEKKDDELGAETQSPYQSAQGDVIGSLIIEQIDSVQSRDLIAPRVDLVCQHSARAIGQCAGTQQPVSDAVVAYDRQVAVVDHRSEFAENVGDFRSDSGYVAGVVSCAQGFHAAGRWNVGACAAEQGLREGRWRGRRGLCGPRKRSAAGRSARSVEKQSTGTGA